MQKQDKKISVSPIDVARSHFGASTQMNIEDGATNTSHAKESSSPRMRQNI